MGFQVDLGGLWVFGTMVFSCLIFTVQYRVMLITATWTSITAAVLLFSFFLFFLMLLVYGVWYSLSWDYYWVPAKLAFLINSPRLGLILRVILRR